MTVPSSSPGNASRQALAERLAALRQAAGLSGNALARRMGVVQSRVWKIEHGQLLPAEDDITAWVRETVRDPDTGETAEELISMLAEARSEQQFSAVVRRKGGLAAYQDQVRGDEEQSVRIGEFHVSVIPGPLQTADYARSLMSLGSSFAAWGASDEIDRAVANRLRRQEILHDPSKKVQFVLGEGALRTLVVPPDVLVGQLNKLLSVMWLPAVDLRVIPFSQRMPALPLNFRIYDDRLVVAESIAAERKFYSDEEPKEVATYVEAFNELRMAAAAGADAEAIIQRVHDEIAGAA